jgi:hypothetical protein
LKHCHSDLGSNAIENPLPNGDACPPNIVPSHHEENLHAFVEAANKALEHAYPHPPAGANERYSQVSVLLLRWKQDDLGVISELRQLQAVFEDAYGFDTESFDIPEEDPEKALASRVLDFRGTATQDRLLIVYYGGHSDDQNPQHSVWRRYGANELSLSDWH